MAACDDRSCKDCGKHEPDVSFRKGRRICKRCESIRKYGERAPCVDCGVDLYGRPPPSIRCEPCAEEKRRFYKQRTKRKTSYLRAIRAGFEGSFADYLHDRRCPMARWARDSGIVVRVIPIRPKTHGMSEAERWRYRYTTDPVFNLRERMRASARKHRRFGCINTRLREGMDGRGGRCETVFQMLGYSPEDLRDHLEKQFNRGMSWCAFMRGEIHIDHVVPVSAYDLGSEEEVIRCWSLPNLQPLWARDNMRKAKRLEALC